MGKALTIEECKAIYQYKNPGKRNQLRNDDEYRSFAEKTMNNELCIIRINRSSCATSRRKNTSRKAQNKGTRRNRKST